MRRIISLAILLTLSWTLFDDVLFAQMNKQEPQTEAETKIIDLTADIVYPFTLNDTVEVMCLVGNFAAQHNGAIITADSAVRYSDKRLECFGNVLINKNTTYAYADKADYNGEINEVNLYAPIVKVIDGEAVLYCYNFSFNTLDNIGFYMGGGVMINGESVMESITGYYYSDTKELIGVGEVQLHGDEYEMTSDSIIYNTETEAARYFTSTNIWNKEDEYLYADEGDYDKVTDRYSFSLNGYILTEEQEMWSDSMDYYRATEHIYMRENIQIDDTTQKSLIFGDYGEYIKNPGDITLIGNPSIINYDLEQNSDSLFMRADTFQIFTLNRFSEEGSAPIVSATDMAKEVQQEVAEELAHEQHSHEGHSHEGHSHEGHSHEGEEPHGERGGRGSSAQSQSGGTPPPPPAGVDGEVQAPRVNVGSQGSQEQEHGQRPPQDMPIAGDSLTVDSLAVDTLAVDSLAVDSLAIDSLQLDSLRMAADTLNRWQRIKANYTARQQERATVKAKEDAARKVILDSIGRERQIRINEKLDAERVREARQVAQRQARLSEKEKRRVRRDVARGKVLASDTTAMMEALAVDTTINLEPSSWRKELETAVVDSLAADSIAMDSLLVDSLAVESVKVDSLYRLTKGYRNVRIYRSDFQAVADSMVTSSIDSIIRLYIEPILWHDSNQVTSEVMDIYTANNQMEKAIFTGGSPIMASELEAGVYYNQVAGRVITTLFADGTAYRNDVDGNAQTLYFMQDDETTEVNGLMVMDSGSATFYIEDQTVVGITYRGEPTYTLYPLNMVPADQSLSLSGFTWQSELRPTQESVFDRTIRPSVREVKSAIPRPEFPIHIELDTHRQELIEAGEWIDRNDLVSPRAEAWMESLGLKTGQPREEQ